MDNNSNNQPVAPVQPPQPVQPVAPQAPQPVAQAQYAPAPTPKKSKTILFVIIGAAVALIAALLVGFFVIKGNADKAADSYTSSLDGYVTKLATAASDSSDDAIKLADNMNDVKMPKLDDVFLSGISSKYTDAKKAGENLTSKVAGFNERATAIVDIKKFDVATEAQIEKMRDAVDSSTITAANAVSRFKQGRTILEDTITLTKDAKVPSELSSAKSDLTTAYQDELIAINLVISAYQEKNVDDYTQALEKMNSAAIDENAAWAKFATYLSTLSSEIDTLSSDIEAVKGNA